MGVIHRDIKPANLMLDAAGHLWVTDFGLAKLETAASMTVSGDLLGTLRYMSPEQALARHGMVDHRTDVYSLGATLYELLTLRPAVTGEDKHAILRQIAFEEPVALRKIEKSIPTELETIALKCLAKNPAERYATAGELAEDLRHWLEDRPIRARPPTLGQRATKWVRRHRALAAAYGLFVLVLVLGGLGLAAAWLWQSAEGARKIAEDASENAESSRVATEKALEGEKQARTGESNALQKQLAISALHRINLAHAAWHDDEIARARSLLEQCPLAMRDWEWRYLYNLCHDEAFVFPVEKPANANTAGLGEIRFDNDGRHLRARQATLGSVIATCWDLMTGKAEQSTEQQPMVRRSLKGAALTVPSPDGKRVAIELWFLAVHQKGPQVRQAG